MKSNNNRLDNFIQDALKSPDSDLHPVDWSEVEVLLRHGQKSILGRANKKSILISAAAVIILIGVFGIFKIIQYYSSLPAETETRIDSTNSTFSIIDPPKVIANESTSSMIDTVKFDSTALSAVEHKTNSIPAVSDDFLKKTNDKQTSAIANQNQNKKQKQNNVKSLADTSSVKTILESPPVDTALKHALQEEIKPDAPPPLPDTSKTSAPVKKSRKNKRQKNTSADSSRVKTEFPSETKPDSLKQR